MNILGVSAHFHDSACCVLKAGKLVAAAEEERFTRVKHDPNFPAEAINYCLREAALTLPDIDCVAYYENPARKLARQLWAPLPDLPLARPEALGRFDARRPERDIRELLGYDGRVEFLDHHLAHAASSYYYSGFSEAAILTVDGVGEWATTTYGRADGSKLELFEEVSFPHSLGVLYSTITAYLGFEVNEAEYKVMGLAPYGEPTHVDKIRALVRSGPRGQYRLDLRYFDFFRGRRMYSDALVELFGQPPRVPESELSAFHHDVARSLQAVLEDILLEKARYLHMEVPSENLCMAGGVALNCVANGRILREGPFKRLFVQPAASDAGGALGAAALAHVRLTGERPSNAALEHVFLGPRYGSSEVAALVRSTGLKALDFRGRTDELLSGVVDRLADGKVIGWFQGRMEFGPRALGARSILADPRGPDTRDRINAVVKMREAFRPFAPSVLASRAAEHFDLDHASPFMLETCQVRSPLDLPAITHVDRSARVQTVAPETNPRFAALIERFAERTGCPILLNTSFNLRGEPIVNSPVEALSTLLRSGIDALALEDFLIDRDVIPMLWFVGAQARHTNAAARSGVSSAVYTFL